jgi:hypothetical protein
MSEVPGGDGEFWLESFGMSAVVDKAKDAVQVAGMGLKSSFGA